MVGIGRRQLALRDQRREARPRLDRQLIERQMPGAITQSLRQFRFPIGLALPRPGVDEVEADAVEHALRRRQRRQPFVHAMRASQEL